MPLINQYDISEFRARYCRGNGVAGPGFYICRFLYMPTKTRVQAIVFDTPGHVAMTTTSNGTAAFWDDWRGDAFEPALREAIAQFAHGAAVG